jgi:hypothetical protein
MSAKMNAKRAAPALRSGAWLLRGISSIPGELALSATGSISFTAFNTGSAWVWQLRKLERAVQAPGIAESIDQGQRSLVFQWPAQSVQAWCPWYYFGGGIKLRHGSLVLRFSFGEPGNAKLRANAVDAGSALQSLAEGSGQVRAMRSVGAAWLSALGVSAASSRLDGP